MSLINKLKAGFFAITLSGCGVFTNNFHDPIPGILYRSGQMSPSDLESTIKKHYIQSVINLRGTSSKEWYTAEQAVCQRNNVEHYTVRLSARRKPTRDEMLQLFSIFDNAQIPIQIHCLAGADRTGLAVAAYLLDKRCDYERAIEALDFIPYGHIEGEIDEFFEQYKNYRESGGLLSFRNWVREEYTE